MSRGVWLVVGGAGFIGSMLTRKLAGTGPVRVFDNLSTGRAANIAGVDGVELRVGSILNTAEVADAFEGVEVIFHLACLGVRHSIHNPIENHEVNARGTLNLCEEARRRGVRRLVYTSTSEVYGTAVDVPMSEEHPARPHTVYGASKLAGEAYVRAYHLTYGLPTVILRPFNSYGPRSHHEGDSGEVIPRFLVRNMNGLPATIFGNGQQTRDFTYVEDTATGIAAAATAPAAIGETINLGTGVEVRIVDLAERIAAATAYSGEPEYRDARPGDVLRLCADSKRAHALLGWKPTVDLDEGCGRLLAWHRDQGTDWAAALSEQRVRNWEV
jgi:UDP-glucose 4-epimerase